MLNIIVAKDKEQLLMTLGLFEHSIFKQALGYSTINLKIDNDHHVNYAGSFL